MNTESFQLVQLNVTRPTTRAEKLCYILVDILVVLDFVWTLASLVLNMLAPARHNVIPLIVLITLLTLTVITFSLYLRVIIPRAEKVWRQQHREELKARLRVDFTDFIQATGGEVTTTERGRASKIDATLSNWYT